MYADAVEYWVLAVNIQYAVLFQILQVISMTPCAACLKSNVRYCGDVVNAFMKRKSKKRAFTKSVDSHEMRRLIRARFLPCVFAYTVATCMPVLWNIGFWPSESSISPLNPTQGGI